MGYASVRLVKDLTQIKYNELGFSSEHDYDDFIQQLIDYASRLVDDYCGQSFSDPVPQTIKLVTALIVSNMLHMILQRKISPVIQTTNVVVKAVEAEAFTNGLKMLLDPYRKFEVTRG